ncbi:MAG: TolC family protein [Bacteroidota bacterium]
MFKYWTLFFAAIISTPVIFGQNQEAWSLRECIEYAHQNNITVKQQELNLKNIELDVKQSKLNMLPSVNGSASHYYSWGKYVDPFTNEFSTERIMGDQFGAQAYLSLYEGMQKQNTLKRNRMKRESEEYSHDKLLDDIALNIANQFVAVLYAMENLETARNQHEITKQQVERTRKLVEAGTLARGDLLNISSQAAAEEYNVVQAENELDIAYLNLAQLLDLEDTRGFTIEKPALAMEQNQLALEPVEAVYNYALENQPEIKNAELQVGISEKETDIAKGALHPSLELSGSISTGYSQANRQVESYSSQTMPVGFTESGEDVYAEQQVPDDYGTVPFSDQLDENLSETINFRLNIPIFNNWSARTGIDKARLQRENAKYELEREKQNLRKNIQTAHADARAAQNQYLSAQAKVEATQEAFRYAEKRFNVGVINSVEYNDAKKELTNARSQLLSAKYRFVFTKTVLDYYLGKPINIAK